MDYETQNIFHGLIRIITKKKKGSYPIETIFITTFWGMDLARDFGSVAIRKPSRMSTRDPCIVHWLHPRWKSLEC